MDLGFDLKRELDERLKEDWKNLFKSLGVSSFEELIQKSGKKDKSKLIPVKKQVTRQGKTYETTVYVSPKEAEEIKQRKNQEEETTGKRKGKAEVSVVSPNSDEIEELHKQLDAWNNKEASKALKDATKDHFLLVARANGEAIGVGAFKRNGNNLEMSHFGTDKKVRGVGRDIVRQLIAEASGKNLGVIIHPPSKASEKFLKKLGLTKKDGAYVGDSEKVKEISEGIKSKKEKTKTEKLDTANEKANKENTNTKTEAPNENESEHKRITKHLRSIRKQLGSDMYRRMLKANGIKWQESDHQGVNTMRATMAAAEFIKKGGKLDINKVDEINLHLEKAKELARKAKDIFDWQAMLAEHPKIFDEVRKYIKETGIKASQLFKEFEGGSEYQEEEYAPVSEKAIDDFELGTPKFSPEDVRFIRPNGNRKQDYAGSAVENYIEVGEIYNSSLKNPEEKTYKGLDHVMLHELGHVISNCYPNLEKHILENPQGALGRTNLKKRRFEGVTFAGYSPEESFAEAFALYHLDKDKLPEKAQEFVKTVIDKLGSGYDKFIETASKEMEKLRKLGDVKKLPTRGEADKDIEKERNERLNKNYNPDETETARILRKRLKEGHFVGSELSPEEFDKLADSGIIKNMNYLSLLEKESVEAMGFNEVTYQGLAYTFNPDETKYKVQIDRMRIYADTRKPGHHKALFNIILFDKENRKMVASLTRVMTYISSENRYEVKNGLFEVSEDYQGKDIATKIYFQTEQMLKTIAKGKEVHLLLEANMEVGKYAWARHGFDFKEDDTREHYQKSFKQFVSEVLNENPDEYIKNLGYNSYDEIQHAWQFAALDDGQEHDLQTNSKNFNSADAVKGKGNIGKKFLLSMSSWQGKKVLNKDGDGEKIGNLYYKHKGIR